MTGALRGALFFCKLKTRSPMLQMQKPSHSDGQDGLGLSKVTVRMPAESAERKFLRFF